MVWRTWSCSCWDGMGLRTGIGLQLFEAADQVLLQALVAHVRRVEIGSHGCILGLLVGFSCAVAHRVFLRFLCYRFARLGRGWDGLQRRRRRWFRRIRRRRMPSPADRIPLPGNIVELLQNNGVLITKACDQISILGAEVWTVECALHVLFGDEAAFFVQGQALRASPNARRIIAYAATILEQN